MYSSAVSTVLYSADSAERRAKTVYTDYRKKARDADQL